MNIENSYKHTLDARNSRWA